jgi:hypothetical protein
MVMKASEKTPLSTIFFAKLATEAGVPPGVLDIVNGPKSTGAVLASHMGIRKISFTGSVGTGKKIAQMAAASNLKRVTLELGGKSPSIVFPDANMENAVRWCTQGIVTNSGQACISSSRVYASGHRRSPGAAGHLPSGPPVGDSSGNARAAPRAIRCSGCAYLEGSAERACRGLASSRPMSSEQILAWMPS